FEDLTFREIRGHQIKYDFVLEKTGLETRPTYTVCNVRVYPDSRESGQTRRNPPSTGVSLERLPEALVRARPEQGVFVHYMGSQEGATILPY
ncbi:MAG: hypothetical protein R6U98_36565, partial [Pirellulaceae bacterium]